MNFSGQNAESIRLKRSCMWGFQSFCGKHWIIQLTFLLFIGISLLFPFAQTEARLRVGLKIKQKKIKSEQQIHSLASEAEEMLLESFKKRGWDAVNLPDADVYSYAGIDAVVLGEVTLQVEEEDVGHIIGSGLSLKFLRVDLSLKVIEASTEKILAVKTKSLREGYSGKPNREEKAVYKLTKKVIPDIMRELSEVQPRETPKFPSQSRVQVAITASEEGTQEVIRMLEEDLTSRGFSLAEEGEIILTGEVSIDFYHTRKTTPYQLGELTLHEVGLNLKGLKMMTPEGTVMMAYESLLGQGSHQRRKAAFRMAAGQVLKRLKEKSLFQKMASLSEVRPKETPKFPPQNKEGSLPQGDTASTSSLTPSQSPLYDFRKVRDKWALVIGIARFQDSRIRSLNYTDDDAQAMYHFLTDPDMGRFRPDHVIKLINEQATTKSIKKAIDKIAKSSKQDDIVVIYISTHGTPGRYDLADVGYLVTHDTDVDSLYGTAYEMVHLTEALAKRVKAQRAVAFMDTCYSAESFQGETRLALSGAKDLVLEDASVSERSIKKIIHGIGRVLITSSREDERSWESDMLKHGYFTHYLIEALSQAKGYATMNEVYRYLKKTIPFIVRKEKNKPQHPVMGSSVVGGNISIGIPPSTP